MKGFVLIFLIGSHSVLAFIPFFFFIRKALVFVLLAYLFFFTKLKLIQTRQPQNMLKV